MSWTDHETTKIWLSKQAIWHGKDMWMAFAVGAVVGIVIGLLI